MHIFLENLYYRICSSLNILNRQRDDSNRMEWHRLEIGDRQQSIQTNTYLNLIMYSNSDAQPNVNMYRRLWDSNAVK